MLFQYFALAAHLHSSPLVKRTEQSSEFGYFDFSLFRIDWFGSKLSSLVRMVNGTWRCQSPVAEDNVFMKCQQGVDRNNTAHNYKRHMHTPFLLISAYIHTYRLQFTAFITISS